MKKTYINPQTLVVDVQTQPVMGTVSGGDRLMEGKASASGGALSRGSNTLWDDDDEE